jgi:hypothetical protein
MDDKRKHLMRCRKIKFDIMQFQFSAIVPASNTKYSAPRISPSVYPVLLHDQKNSLSFINEKLLQQVEHCYIATAAISEAGFDFIRTRIPTKTKMEIITGLEMPTSPAVLQRIWRNYQGRITLNIYTHNEFHANVYIFDLPYRKSLLCRLRSLHAGGD